MNVNNIIAEDIYIAEKQSVVIGDMWDEGLYVCGVGCAVIVLPSPIPPAQRRLCIYIYVSEYLGGTLLPEVWIICWRHWNFVAYLKAKESGYEFIITL